MPGSLTISQASKQASKQNPSYVDFLVRKKIYVLIFVVFYSFFIFSPFLYNERWTSDSYCVSIFGYEYMWRDGRLIEQGRPFSHLYYRLLDFLNLPLNVTVFLSALYSLVFLSISSYIVYFTIDKYVGVENRGKYTAIVTLAGCVSIFFNLFFLESFLFLENSIMSLGVLLTALSACSFVRNGTSGYFMGLFFLIGGVFCYQADVAYFPPLVIIILYAKYAHDIKRIIKKTTIAAITYFAALISNYCFIRVCVAVLGTSDGRIVGGVDVIGNLRNCYRVFIKFAINHFGFTPNYIYTAVISALLCILIYHIFKEKEIGALAILPAAFLSLAVCTFIPHVLMSSFYVMPRSLVAMSGIGGMIIICLPIVSKKVNVLTAFICACYC